MADLDFYLNAIATGSRASDITGIQADTAKAGAYSAWIQSVTGKPPAVVDLGNNQAKLMLDKEQIALLQAWLDNQVGTLFTRKTGKPSSIQYELGPALTPWALKYALPISAGLFLAGWLSHYYFGK